MYTKYIMLFVSILHHYLLWHYTYAFLEIFHVWTNFFWFIVNFFSIPQLFRSLFSPWKRIVEERKKSFDFEDIAGVVIIGLFSRIIGFTLRSVIIISGLFTLALLLIFLFIVYIFWLLAPAFMIGSLVYGVILMFS